MSSVPQPRTGELIATSRNSLWPNPLLFQGNTDARGIGESRKTDMVSPDRQKAIALWLLVCCATVFAMVVLGGATRLTGSGLSMVKWEPITGVLPPLSQEQWTEVFELYQQFPEYKAKNFGMSLGEFKSIFWWEYAHRLLGRLIGILFFAPLIFFVVTGGVSRSLVPKLVLLFLLGGLQGLLGWYMVKSGLARDPHVSQYRLTAHLGLALTIYGYMFWVALDLLYPAGKGSGAKRRSASGLLAALISFVVFVTALSGGLVAGSRAGFAYNTFPTMAGQWIPAALFAVEPLWRNFFENLTTIQFDHRVLATLAFCLVVAFWATTRHITTPTRLRIGIHLLLVAACLQIALGISTLLFVVPIPLAVAHQGAAVLLLTASLFVLHEIRPSHPGS
jgi:cytochrome c oxidase assembly protein subunit 15